MDLDTIKLLHDWMSTITDDPNLDELQQKAVTRFQQLSAPVAAKSVEDTAFYRYGRLLSRNDVGFDVDDSPIALLTSMPI